MKGQETIFSRARLDGIVPIICFVAFVKLVFVICSPELLKKIGNTLLFIPEKLGLVQRVSPNEIRPITLRNGVIVQRFEPGRYMVFTNDTGLLFMVAAIETRMQEPASPGLTIRSAGNSMRDVRVTSVNRGLRPYDTPHAKGRPILRFDISEAGVYEILYDIKGLVAAVSIVPDRTSGNEWLITILSLTQITIVVAPLCAYYACRRKKAIAARQRLQREQRHQGDELMALYRKRRLTDD